MYALIQALALLLPAAAWADSQCIALEGATELINRCEICMEATVLELRPPAEQHAGVYSGVSRTVRLEAGNRESLPGRGSWMLGDLRECR